MKLTDTRFLFSIHLAHWFQITVKEIFIMTAVFQNFHRFPMPKNG